MTEIYHHGIKGMKWGVRRFQKRDGTRTDAGKIRWKEGIEWILLMFSLPMVL